MKDRLIHYLACPDCHGDLYLEDPVKSKDFPWQEIMSGNLTCQKCQRKYPIIGGIPRMLTNSNKSIEEQKTVEGFGFEWKTYNRKIQHTYMSTRENFLDFIHPVKNDFFKDKIVLDAGCGMGRFLKLAAEFGSREIIGMDLSSSVEAAYSNTCHLPNAHVVQGDIMKLPLKQEFDYIFSIGVLQFIPQPDEGFRKLTGLLKPSGSISIWVYSKENNGWVMRILSPIRELITSRIPRPLLYFLCRTLGLLYFVFLRIFYLPANEWKIFKSLGVKLPYNDYFYYNLRLSYIDLTSIIFDHMVPHLVVYLSREEILDWFERAKLEVIISSRNSMSWRAHGSL
jgi:uncharacterized protein YbaR (Trm112 family)/SAM-dependent methyltransferase